MEKRCIRPIYIYKTINYHILSNFQILNFFQKPDVEEEEDGEIVDEVMIVDDSDNDRRLSKDSDCVAIEHKSLVTILWMMVCADRIDASSSRNWRADAFA